MPYSSSFSETTTFTVTHARRLASKVATDLKRMQRFYGRPSSSMIEEFEAELILLLRAGYLGTVMYGFKRNATWILPTLRYTSQDLASSWAADDDPGRVPPRCDIGGAYFSSFLTYSGAWRSLSTEEQAAFEATLPFQRAAGSEDGAAGFFLNDKTYSAGGRSLSRETLRP